MHGATINALGCLLGGPEDDLIRSKHVALTSILFYGIWNKNAVLLTDILYLYTWLNVIYEMWFYFKKNTITFQSVPKSAASKWLLLVNLPYEAKSIVMKISVQVHELLISHVIRTIKKNGRCETCRRTNGQP